MNTFLQVAIGLAPVEIFLLLYAFLKKKPRIPQFIAAAVVGCCIITSVALSFQGEEPGNKTVIREKEAVQQLDVIYAVANHEGNVPYAAQLLRQLREDATDNSRITMCDAFLCAAQGDWRGADSLYQKAVKMGEAENQVFADACQKAAAYAESVFSGEQQTGTSAIDELKELAVTEISRRSAGSSTDAGQTAGLLVKSKAVFDAYLETGTLDREQAKQLSASMAKVIEDNASLLRMSEVRNTRTKLYALCGYYGAIAGNIDEDATYSELAIVSELYLNGLVNESSFRDEFVEEHKKMAEAVAVQLQIVLKNISDTATADRINSLIDELSAKDPTALEILQDAISGIADDNKNTNKPKAHIQLAKIYHYHDKSTQAKGQISAALSSVGVSRDEAFYTPLQKLAGVVNNKDNSAELKNVAGYVAEVLDNTADPIVVAVIEDIRAQQAQKPEEPTPEETTPETSAPVETTPKQPVATEPDEMRPATPDDTVDEAPSHSSGDKTGFEDSFATFMGDTINQLRISINITAIDAINFPKVTATVNIDGDLAATAEELKEMIKLSDCGIEITDLTVEKVEVSTAQILLCCDVSGSMSGQPIEDLKNAVKLFVETASDKEDLSLVTFSSYVEDVYSFGTDRQTLIDSAGRLYANGGTNMYGALIESISKFSDNTGGLKYILLLSDGDDGTSRSESEISENIGYPAMDKGVVVYSLAVGPDVNLEYLGTLANVTGGEYLHVQDTATLQNFYDGLRNQMLNQYIITFEAKDTLRANRELKITLTGDGVSEGVASYYLEQAGADTQRVDSLVTIGQKGVSHLETSKVLKGDCDTKIKIYGFGFAEDDSISVELDGKQNYDSDVISCVYLDENTLEMTVPGGLACDKYDVKINIGLMSTTIKNGIFIINQDLMKTTEHGPYRFTSYEKVEANGLITLSGEVTLNDWLVFEGDVVLRKSDSDVRELILTDRSGAHIDFNPNTATGLARLMAKADKRFYIPALGEITLINEITANPSDDAYPVRQKNIPGLYINGVLGVEEPGVALYPYKLAVQSDAFTTELPMQEQLVSAAGMDLFSFDVAVGGSVGPNSIDIKAEIKHDDVSSLTGSYKSSNMGAMPLYISPSDVELLIDTAANEYKLEFMVKVSFIDGDGIGLRLKWSARDGDQGAQFLIPSEVILKAGVDIPGQIGPVPVTYGNFEVGLSDIDPNESILMWKLEGGFDVSTGKLSELIPGLEEIFEDPALLTLNPHVTLSLGQAYFKLDANLKLLETIELADASIQAGKIPVNSVLLGFENEWALGMQGTASGGLNWSIPNCSVDVDATADIHLHNKFLGVQVSGDADVEIGWAIFTATLHEHGTVAVGFQRIDDMPTFVVKVMNSDRNSSEGYYLLWNKESHMKFGKMDV